MYKVLIVDDEKYMRKGLGILINWSEYGFAVDGEASNGMEALALMEKQDYDVVITDVRMPKLNGLELAKKIYEMNFRTKVIIISGYKEFEYASTAIEFGVKKYILKPVDKNMLIDALLKIKKKLEEENPGREMEKERADLVLQDGAASIIAHLEKYIAENCSSDISLQSIAKDFNYNSAYLGRIFRKVMNTSYRDYLNRCRVKKAAEILREGKYKIHEVCELAGYRDINYFCSVFKEIKGVTPSEFKAQNYILS